ncbi:MAG: TatD family hydrolase [Firmicutes bacterium]|nr:TatD family hydrolase [Bacillota bacterium]
MIDTHAHLTDPRLDAAEILGAMEADGLSRIITVGYDRFASYEGFKIAQSHAHVFCTLGFHPSNTDEANADEYARILELSRNPKVVGIGEIGLDYHYDDTDKPVQLREFLNQLDLVKSADLPVVIHMRDADADMFSIIKDNLHKLPKRGVMHCFSGSLESALEYIKLGFYISFSGAITFKNARVAPSVAQGIPQERILIETDCPYLAPEPFRGRQNYPKYVRYVCERIAVLRGVSAEEMEEITTRNAYAAFDKLR